MVLNSTEMLIAETLAEGLPICSRPYQKIGEAYGLSERQVIETISSLCDKGVVSRFGLIVRHRKIGFTENAMVVWDIPDDQVVRVGEIFAARKAVTLCYQRPRRLPQWPYNLFCMIHGRERDVVMVEVAKLVEVSGITNIPYDVLFSTHAYKQRGAKYSQAEAVYAAE